MVELWEGEAWQQLLATSFNAMKPLCFSWVAPCYRSEQGLLK